MTASPHIVFSGGGTAGHLFPGIAVADELCRRSPGIRITFAGSGREQEREHVRAAAYEYLSVPCHPWPRRAWMLPKFVANQFAGYRTASRFLQAHDVSVVVGLGGFASVPMAKAAVSRDMPLVLLEQNAVPGRANRWLGSSATHICTAFDSARYPWKAKPGVVTLTGNPVRSGFLSAQRSNGHRPTLLVLGGSGGARELNQHVPHALARLASQLKDWSIVHQCGRTDLGPTTDLYLRLRLRARVLPFIDDMPATLASADLAICRAGGTTLAELAVAGVPAILCPYPHAADDHQRANADAFATAGAARVVDSRDAVSSFAGRLATEVAELLSQDAQWVTMGAAMCKLARSAAACEIAEIILSLTDSARRGQAA